MNLNLNIEGFTFPELYTNLEELGIDPMVDLVGSEQGGVQRIEDDLFLFVLPDGRKIFFTSAGKIEKID